MPDDMKRDVDVMRATTQVMEILMPFTDEQDRVKILAGAAVFALPKLKASMLGRTSLDLDSLLDKVKPKG
jgi:hypothetical protein